MAEVYKERYIAVTMETIKYKSINVPSSIITHGLFEDRFFHALRDQRPEKVFVLEGRPSLESCRHACRHLLKLGIRPVIISDNMAGFLFFRKMVRQVWLAYQDRDGEDAVCLTGGLVLSVLAKRHHVPVFLSYASRKQEDFADEKEIFSFNGIRVAPKGIRGYVPLVETVPLKYVTKVV